MLNTPAFAAVILAAGKGTRMRSDIHKVLHPLAGRPMLGHLLEKVDALGPAAKVVVVGAGRAQVEAYVGEDVAVAVQEPQLGTAHAVRQAEAALAGFAGAVVVLYGDVPLVSSATIGAMLARLDEADAPGVVVLGFRPAETLAYGRIIADGDGHIAAMVEYKDASEAQRSVRLCNSGLLAARAADLWGWLAEVDANNAAGEYYLPDVVTVAARHRRKAVVIETDATEVTGVNSRAELAALEGAWQSRRRARAMDEGATLIAPETVWFSHDTKIGRDVLVEPNVFFGRGVTVADGVTIRAFSHLEGATVAAGAEIGPYARLRPGAEIGERAKVGNFVEVKKARLGAGAKANHLSYLGDAEIGAGANVGAGTITCNYDGFLKYRTTIGAGAFIGSNSALVAPVTIGAGAIVAAGSVVTQDVAADALAVARERQEVRKDWAIGFRKIMADRKKADD